MSHNTMIVGLLLITFAAAIGWAIWQRGRVKQSQERSGDPEGRKATADAEHNHKSTK